MKTRNEVINFIRSKSQCGDSIMYATMVSGSNDFTISSFDFADELSLMNFDGKVNPIDVCDDIKEWREYVPEFHSVYQFSNDKGIAYQILVF